MPYRYLRLGRNKDSYSLESCDLNGANRTKILSVEQMDFPAWIAPGRIVYSQCAEGSTLPSCNLWELRVDDKTGTPQGKPRPLTDWLGFFVSGLSATADGRHLAFVRHTAHPSIFVGDLVGQGNRLLNVHRLTMDDYWNVPQAWTADSKEVIFLSDRGERQEIYKQALDGSTAEAITSSVDCRLGNVRLSPDGAWLLYVSGPPKSSPGKPWRLFRVSVNGGATQPLIEFPKEPPYTFWCTNRAANFCAYPTRAEDGRSWVIMAFDPAGSGQRELLRIPTGYDWGRGLSPDGSQIAVLKSTLDTSQIRFIPLRGGEARTVTVKGYVNLGNLFYWGPDSRSMFAATYGPGGTTVLRIDLNGKAQPLWHQPEKMEGMGIPSPDGCHLAMVADSAEANVWMTDNF